MSISFTRVTWYSQLVAIILFVAVFFFGFHLGKYAVAPTVEPLLNESSTSVSQGTSTAVAGATFDCSKPANSFISTIFYKSSVQLILSDGRTMTLPHALSADGARYANADESFVFWNKGKTAFVTENGTTTYDGCVTK